MIEAKLLEHIHSSDLTQGERVQICCTIALEQIEIGDFDAGCAALRRWWVSGERPKTCGLPTLSAAEMLFTAGTLSGWVASTKQQLGGQKEAEGLISGAIALFEQLEETQRAAECRIELAYCYYREGLFDLARKTLASSLKDLSSEYENSRSVALIRLAIVERHSGRLRDALALLNEAATVIDSADSWGKGRFHLELATTLKNLGLAENSHHFLEAALEQYPRAFEHFQAIGNLRYSAIVENNQGYLLSSLKRFGEAEAHLKRARKLFDSLRDEVRRAQVDETIAQLYLASGKYDSAQDSISSAVETLETSGDDALLAESLTTQGQILIKLGRRHEAKPILERAHRVAERCGDHEGAGRALLILIEEMCDQLADDERREIGTRANQLLANSQQKLTRDRLKACLERIAAAHAEYEQRREMAAHAEKMAALGELSFGVAHNVNNTLTGILGRAQLLLRTTDAEKITKGIETIIKSAEDGAQIIRRIQDFARRQPSREFQAVAVAELLKDVCEMSRPRWEAQVNGADIQLTLVADCTASVMGDPVELREVLVNMIYNAVDAMPAGGQICLGVEECGGRAVLSIADSGTGMTATVKSRLFDPFFTTKGRGGTGMGLAVSFGIIRRHNGTIDVESEPGQGTTFRISLPLADAGQPVASAESLSQSSRGIQNAVRVMVVDDEPAVRDVLQEALEAEGFDVLTAESGEQALRLYDERSDRVDIIFTDIGMPGMNGWDLAREIRKRSTTIPLAIVSGWAEAISCEARQEIGAEWVVPKPFDLSSITEIAKEAAARRHLAELKPEVMNKNVCKLLGM